MIALLLALTVSSTIVDDLYGRRLLFGEDGRPLVPLGMMQGQQRVVVSAANDGGLVIDVGDVRVEATSVVIELKSSTPGVAKTLQVVETLENQARSEKRKKLEEWKAKGVDVRAYDVGGVYGVKGTVVDNRAVLIAAATLPPTLVDVRPVPIEWMETPPTAVLRVTTSTGTTEGAFVRVRAKNNGVLKVEKVEHSKGYAEHGFEDRLLRDEVIVVPDAKGLLAVVNVVDENDMVAGVLPSEMFATAPLEALKAQAVTARGELFAKIGRRHFTEPYLVCTEQHCQVYRGVTAETARTNEAARATAGELAFKDGHVVDSVYSACCGGHTEPADIVWDRPKKAELVGTRDAPSSRVSTSTTWLKPELAAAFFHGPKHTPRVPEMLDSDDKVRAFLDTPRDGAWCGRSTLNQKGAAWRWEKRFERPALDVAFKDLNVGTVTKIAVEERGPGGRLRALRVDGTAGTGRVLRELPLRKRLGNLRSGLFVIDEERDAEGGLVAVTLHGAGFGHGSGMCQQGAIGMAEAGASYRDILAHYYNGAVVKPVF